MSDRQRLPATRPHYEVLDGLRGLAAIMIVVYHLYEIMITDYTKNPVAHGYLAVDFFFMLSGFVMGYAYDDRLRQIGFGQFLRKRLIRLHPMVLWGGVLGLLGYLFDPYMATNVIATVGWGKILFVFLCTMVLIPSPVLPDTYENNFPLNAPAWSLFVEYIMNIFYALVLVRVKKLGVLVLLLLLGLAALIIAGHTHGVIGGGWGAPNFWDGFARVLFSFTFGLLIFRSNAILKNKIPFWILGLLLIGSFFIPHRDNDWITEILIVALVYPILLSLGAGARVSGTFKKFCVFTGRLSYPLYMTHYWVMWIFIHYLASEKPGGVTMYSVAFGIFSAMLLLGYIALKYYDEPVRAWLTRKYNGKS